MRAIILMFLCALPAQQLPSSVRVALISRSNVSSSEIGKTLDSHCPNVTITALSERADFMLEAIDTGAGAGRKPYKFTVFNANGDRVFSTETASIAGAVRGVCRFMLRSDGK